MKRHAGTPALLSVFVLLMPLFVLLRASPASATAPVAVQVDGGDEHACAIDTSGNAWCWGEGANGRLGVNSTSDSAFPVEVLGGYQWSQIGGGESHTCAVTTGGDAYCWGLNSRGELGNGNTTDQWQPALVSGGLHFSAIATGQDHTCALTTGHKIWCWGRNDNGQLGDGTGNYADSDIPVAVNPSLSFNTLSAAGFHTCALTVGGLAYCWGDNDNHSGTLGNGTTNDSDTPVAVNVSGVPGGAFTQLVAGETTSCGLTSTGAAYCWGENDQGELGDGGGSYSSLPIAVVGGHTFASVSAGGDDGCGLDTSGNAWCWGGGNWDGRLGDGGTGEEDSPVAVLGGHKFVFYNAGGSESCGITAIGIVYCAGGNSNGQVGDGTLNNADVPSQTALYSVSANSTVSVVVDPSLSFTVTGRSSVCNGQSSTNFQTSSGATSVSLGHLSSATVGGGAQDLSVGTNAGNGFVVYLRTSGVTPNSLRDTKGHYISDVPGTSASPGSAPTAGTAGFGYTSSDTTTAFTSNLWAKLTNSNDSILIGSGGTSSKSACIGYEVAVASTTPAGSYASAVIYTAVPSF